MTTVLEMMTAEILTLGVVDRVAPTTLGYGNDLSCVTDLTATMEEVDPDSGAGVAEMTIRRVTTPRGMVIDDLSWGIDLRGYLNHGTTALELSNMESSVRTEVERDDRIVTAPVTVAYAAATRSLTVTIVLTLVATGEVFTLIFFVTADGVELLGSIDKNG